MTGKRNFTLRLTMVKIAVEDFFPIKIPVKVNDIEVKNGHLIPTYLLVKKLEKLYPEITFYFIMGSDLIPVIQSWSYGMNLLEEIHLIIFQREVFCRVIIGL